MEDNKEMMNGQIAAEAKVEDAPELKAEQTVADDSGKSGKWWNKSVSRKFMTIALALTIVLNAGLTMGMNALMARHGRPDKNFRGRPDTEMFSERPDGQNGSNGQMMPPGNHNDGNNNGQMTPPDMPDNGQAGGDKNSQDSSASNDSGSSDQSTTTPGQKS